MRKHPTRGFTIVEVLITVAIIAILGAIALPQYTAYVTRSKVPGALDALSNISTRMELYYQDGTKGNYGDNGACGNGLVMPVSEYFTITCAVTNAGQGFLATATGKSGSSVEGYAYTINHRGTRATTAHPKGTKDNCWTLSGQVCDS